MSDGADDDDMLGVMMILDYAKNDNNRSATA